MVDRTVVFYVPLKMVKYNQMNHTTPNTYYTKDWNLSQHSNGVRTCTPSSNKNLSISICLVCIKSQLGEI